jgi:hypothetical protein
VDINRSWETVRENRWVFGLCSLSGILKMTRELLGYGFLSALM